jgi:hypothetical protein
MQLHVNGTQKWLAHIQRHVASDGKPLGELHPRHGQHSRPHCRQTASAARQRCASRCRRDQRLRAGSAASDGGGYAAGLPLSDLGVDGVVTPSQRYTNEFMAFLQASVWHALHALGPSGPLSGSL